MALPAKKKRKTGRTTKPAPIDSNQSLLLQYDYLVELDGRLLTAQPSACDAPQSGILQDRLIKVLKRGLGNRASHLAIADDSFDSRHCSSPSPRKNLRRRLVIGLTVNAESAGRSVDHGPSPRDETESASFRRFWGDKAELRRFKDGSIRETLVWQTEGGVQSILEQIVHHLVRRHFGGEAEKRASFLGKEFHRWAPQDQNIAQRKSLTEAFMQIERDIRGLDGMPLIVRQIQPADPQFRSTSLACAVSGSSSFPAEVTIQFESSGRWPDDLTAIQRTKIAFLLKLKALLEETLDGIDARVGLENPEQESFNQAFLDIIYASGRSFRMRIHHDREETLLEGQLQTKTADPKSKAIAARGLAMYKRYYIKSPAHTQAMAGLCGRHAAMGGTVELMRKWFASHLLSNHIPSEVVELMVAKTFVQPSPWQSPASVQTGFLRTLHWLSRWDWRVEPLVVDLSGRGTLNQSELQLIKSKFEAWRNIDPAMNRVVLFAASNVDFDGTTWTDGKPAKVVAARMTSLAQAAYAVVESRGLGLEPASLFASDLSDFDFALHLSPELIRGGKQATAKSGVRFKNLDADLGARASLVGLDLVAEFLRDLESIFGAAILFFSGGGERAVIAGLWSPSTAPRRWKMTLPYSTKPRSESEPEEVAAEINKDGILSEIARLGGDMLKRIEVRR